MLAQVYTRAPGALVRRRHAGFGAASVEQYWASDNNTTASPDNGGTGFPSVDQAITAVNTLVAFAATYPADGLVVMQDCTSTANSQWVGLDPATDGASGVLMLTCTDVNQLDGARAFAKLDGVIRYAPTDALRTLLGTGFPIDNYGVLGTVAGLQAALKQTLTALQSVSGLSKNAKIAMAIGGGVAGLGLIALLVHNARH